MKERKLHKKKCLGCGKKKFMRSDRTYCSVKCAHGHKAKAREMKRKLETTVVFGDVHIPFQDDVALGLALSFIEREKPDRVVINGDFLDCYDVSSFDKNPDRKARFKDEIAHGREVLGELRRVSGKAEIIYIYGNHEHRLSRYLNTEARALKGLAGLTIEEQLHLDELDIQFVDCHADKFIDTYIRIGELLIGHFAKVSPYSGYTAKNLLDQYGMSLIQAHVHSMGSSNKVLETGPVMGWEGGCLCSLDPHYTKQKKWMHGFHVVHMNRGGEFFHVEPVSIIDGKYFYGGELFS